ncbi:hypothetical protein NMY22_g13733 [Coprinellus aureogranulatus]|nr:hypothetical protein NMY22_g13733 [Coprinellus aureogranulatus]
MPPTPRSSKRSLSRGAGQKVHECLEVSEQYLQCIDWNTLVTYGQTTAFARAASIQEMRRRIGAVLHPWFPTLNEVDGFLYMLKDNHAVVVGGIVRRLLGINVTNWYIEDSSTTCQNLNIVATPFSFQGVLRWLSIHTTLNQLRPHAIANAFVHHVMCSMKVKKNTTSSNPRDVDYITVSQASCSVVDVCLNTPFSTGTYMMSGGRCV